MAVDGWAVTFDTASRGLGGAEFRARPTALWCVHRSLTLK